ncbi:MAG: hypothetical protein Ct9H300mP1_34010 [Planctomycetaceae bacterium]|nr:MAG: hypothetical protein Ct9H300mP1_34010 [Planctomycetaceae bacterium]
MGKGPRVRIPGQRRGNTARFIHGPLQIDVGNDHAIFFQKSFDGVIAKLNRVHRVSPTMGPKAPGKGAVALFDGARPISSNPPRSPSRDC